MEKKISKSNIKESAVKTVWARLKPFALWLGALLAIGCALLVFEADLLWKVQQHNVFLSSALFFKQQMVVPGGMLSYLGAFFTQHFYHPWVGVVLICGWWLLLMWLTQRTFSIPGRWIVVTLIPVAILLLANMSLGYWVYVIKLSGYFFVPTIGTTAALALIWAFRSLRLSPLTSHFSPLTSHLSLLTSHLSVPFHPLCNAGGLSPDGRLCLGSRCVDGCPGLAQVAVGPCRSVERCVHPAAVLSFRVL